MSNKLQVSKSLEMQKIRVILINNNGKDKSYFQETWFIAADVCKIMGITNTSRAVKNFDLCAKRKVDLHLPGKWINIVSKIGVYLLYISRVRKKPVAPQVVDWIKNSIIPSLLNEYSYNVNAQSEFDNDDLHDYLELQGCTLREFCNIPYNTANHDSYRKKLNTETSKWACSAMLDILSRKQFGKSDSAYKGYVNVFGSGKKKREFYVQPTLLIKKQNIDNTCFELFDLYKQYGWSIVDCRSYVCTNLLKYTPDTDCSKFQIQLITYFTTNGESGLFEMLKANGILFNIPVEGVSIKMINKECNLV